MPVLNRDNLKRIIIQKDNIVRETKHLNRQVKEQLQ